MKTMINSGRAILMICFILPLAMTGQERLRQKPKDRIIQLRKDFIAEGLELTKDQESKFWPIYDSFQIEMVSLKRNKAIFNSKVSDISDDEAERVLTQDLKNRELEMLKKLQFYKDIQLIIPAKQILILNERERLFHKKAFDRVRNRRQNRRGN
ncbi:MAG: hypothetical protein ACI9FN_001592 [Saprospiraceae bacterium]|jgi:hypothetical protein